MIFYKSDAGLDYKEYVILIKLRLPQKENGEDTYLVIDTHLSSTDDLSSGDVIDLYNSEVQETEYDIKKSPLYKDYLFQYFLERRI